MGQEIGLIRESRNLLFEAASSSSPSARWGLYAESYAAANIASRAGLLATGGEALMFLGGKAAGMGFALLEGGYEFSRNPTLQTAYEVAGEIVLGGIGGAIGLSGGFPGAVIGGAVGAASGKIGGDWLYYKTEAAVRQTYNDVRFFATRAYDSAEETIRRIDSHY